jgi:hypothetical protein
VAGVRTIRSELLITSLHASVVGFHESLKGVRLSPDELN